MCSVAERSGTLDKVKGKTSMNIHLRKKIDESIETRQLSENLFFLCLACLNEKITYSKLTQVELEKERQIIAQSALMHDVKKEDIAYKIKTISPKDYPTLKKIKAISKICESNDYVYISDFIPDRMIHYKTDEEIQADSLRKPEIKKRAIIENELSALVTYVEKEIMHESLTVNMVKQIKSLKTDIYTYAVILKTFQWFKEDIVKGTWQQHFNSAYHKFKYILKIVENKLPDAVRKVKMLERIEKEVSDADAPQEYVDRFKKRERPKMNPRLKAMF